MIYIYTMNFFCYVVEFSSSLCTICEFMANITALEIMNLLEMKGL